MLELKMKCSLCYKSSQLCACEDPSVETKAFALIMVKNGTGNYVQLTFKDADVLYNFLDVTSSEQDSIAAFLRTFGEFRIFGDTLNGDGKVSERKKVFTYLNKLISKKVVYGYLMSKAHTKRNEGSIVPSEFKKNQDLRDSYLFCNGTIKEPQFNPLNETTSDPAQDSEETTEPAYCLTYCFAVTHVDKYLASANANQLFKAIFSML